MIGPVVNVAEADLRERVGPHVKIARSAAPASYIARVRFASELQALCLGAVYEVHNGDTRQNAIELLRDGTVTWRRGC